MDNSTKVYQDDDEIVEVGNGNEEISTTTFRSWESEEQEKSSCYDQYLKRSLGSYLTQCLQEVVELKPRDPFEFIAKYLYKCVDSEHYHNEKIKFLQDLVKEKALMELGMKRKRQIITQIAVSIQEQKRILQELRMEELKDIMETLSMNQPPYDTKMLDRLKDLASSTHESSLMNEVSTLDRMYRGQNRKPTAGTLAAINEARRRARRGTAQSIGGGRHSKWRAFTDINYQDLTLAKRLPDGSLRFPDGTIRKPDGVLCFPDGSQELPDGTVRFADGTVRFPDGTMRFPDGRVALPDADAVEIDDDGTIRYPDGTIRKPDGTVIYPDGTQSEPDENGIVTDPDGTLRYPDGTVQLPDGTIIHPDGSIRYSSSDPRNRKMELLLENQDKKYGSDTRSRSEHSSEFGSIGSGVRSGEFKINARGLLEYHDADLGVMAPRLPPIGGSRAGLGRLADGAIRHPDGKIQNPDGTVLLPDGSVNFPDGTKRLPDGTTIYKDGTVRRPDGRITKPDAKKVITDENGNMVYPDGTIRYPDGRVQYPDGSIGHPDDDGIVHDPDGTMRYPDGRIKLPDGTIRYPDGSEVYPEGDPRTKELEYFVDRKGGRHRLNSVSSPYVDDEGAPVTGQFRVNARGLLEYRDADLGVLQPRLPPIAYGSRAAPVRLPDGAVRLPDGKIQNPDGTLLLPDGSVNFPDGTKRLPDGTTLYKDGTVRHADGRVKKPDAKKVTKDENGNMVYPDGTTRYPDGRVEYPDGSIGHPDDDGIVHDPDGTMRYPDGRIKLPDGTVRYPDGSEVYPEGDPRLKKMDFFVDKKGVKHPLASVTTPYSDRDNVDSAQRGGQSKFRPKGYPEDRDRGKLPPIAYGQRGAMRLPDDAIRLSDGRIQNSDGTVLLPDGSVHFPDGTKRLPDGTTLYKDGTERSPDGRIKKPGAKEVFVDDTGKLHYPDGTIRHADGSIEYPDGSIRQPDDDGIVRDPDGTTRYPDGRIEQPDGTVTYPDGSEVYPDGDPRGNKFDYFVDKMGVKHRLAKVTSPYSNRDSVSSALSAGRFRLNARGLLEFHSQDLGVLGARSPIPTLSDDVDDPNYWMTNNFACESLYDHELYTVCHYELPEYPANMMPMTLENFMAPVLPPITSRLRKLDDVIAATKSLNTSNKKPPKK